MAVYTRVSDQELSNLLQTYNIGVQGELIPIAQGIENSNYFLNTETGRYVLTIYEKRVNKAELPFYLNLMNYLSSKDVPCPTPILNRAGKSLSQVAGKPCAIISFLEGKTSNKIHTEHLEELGRSMAFMHLAGQDFDMSRENNFSLQSWQEMFCDIKERAHKIKLNLSGEMEAQLNFLEKNWPTSLPRGVIHADLFPDNVFYTDKKLVGIIDFYFACNDFFMYDIAICLNAWCFEKSGDFNITKARAMLRSYNKVRKISAEELEALPILSSGAAMRFLLTRSYDWLNRVEGALVETKDPMEYLNKIRFHDGIKSHSEYGI